MESKAGTDTTDPGDLRAWVSERPLAVGIAALSFGAAAIHFGVAPDHFSEWVPFGLAFALLGWFQVWWAAIYLARPLRTVALVGAIVNLGVVLVWIYSRTIGLPVGPNAGTREAVGIADTISSELEAILVGAILVRYAFAARRGAVSRPALLAASMVAAAVIVAASVVALLNLGTTMSMGG